jgi:hypothetical protein
MKALRAIVTKASAKEAEGIFQSEKRNLNLTTEIAEHAEINQIEAQGPR